MPPLSVQKNNVYTRFGSYVISSNCFSCKDNVLPHFQATNDKLVSALFGELRH